MEKLTIKKKSDCNEYTVSWGKLDYLGDIARQVDISPEFLFFPDGFGMIGDMWFWSSCLRQIADKLDELNSPSKPKTK